MQLRITWRDAKAAKNWRDHRVAFTEAETVFYSDPSMQTIFDPEHSDQEKRFTTLGYSSRNRLLRITHTEETAFEAGEEFVILHIISARTAQRLDREIYEELNS